MSLSGHLHLICGLDSAGRSVLRHQSFCAPMHLSKPHWDGDTLLVNIVNPTAGLFANDVIESDISVESGARLVLASPSATRAHTMSDGEARVDQRFAIAAGARLEIWPELFIPQRGASYRADDAGYNRARWRVDPLRSACARTHCLREVFAFNRLVWDTDIYHAGKARRARAIHDNPHEP